MTVDGTTTAKEQAPTMDCSNVLLLDQQCYLLVGRRAADLEHEPGKWNLPGGKLEPCETFKLCAARELFEEFGVSLAEDDLSFFRTYHIEYPDRLVRADYFTAGVKDCPPLRVCDEEFSEGGFYAPEKVLSLDLAFNQHKVVSDFLQNHSGSMSETATALVR